MGPPYSEIVEAAPSQIYLPLLDELGRPSGGSLNRCVEVRGDRRNGSSCRAACRFAAGRRLRPGYRYDSLTWLVLERKEDMRRRGAKSPDEWDAVALTFAKPVAAPAPKKPSNFHRKLVYSRMGIV